MLVYRSSPAAATRHCNEDCADYRLLYSTRLYSTRLYSPVPCAPQCRWHEGRKGRKTRREKERKEKGGTHNKQEQKGTEERGGGRWGVLRRVGVVVGTSCGSNFFSPRIVLPLMSLPILSPPLPFSLFPLLFVFLFLFSCVVVVVFGWFVCRLSRSNKQSRKGQRNPHPHRLLTHCRIEHCTTLTRASIAA